MGRHGKPFRRFFYIIRMAHPANGLPGYSLKQSALRVHFYLCPAVFTDRCRRNFSSQKMRHHLRTITDTQHRDFQIKHSFSTQWRTLRIYAVRPSRKNDPFRIHFPELVQSDIIRMYFTIYVAFPDPPRYQLIVLTSKIHNNNHFFFHSSPRSFTIY